MTKGQPCQLRTKRMYVVVAVSFRRQQNTAWKPLHVREALHWQSADLSAELHVAAAL